MDNKNNWSFRNPVKIVSAPLAKLKEFIQNDCVLLVTSSGFSKRGLTELVRLDLSPKKVYIWDKIQPNPDIEDLDFAANQFCDHGITCVLGIGGGSVIDAAKALAVRISNPLGPTLEEVFRGGEEPIWQTRLELVVVPTTSGTGSEVTPFATVWDHTKHLKHSLAGDFVFPDIALLDASLTITLTDEHTLYPGLDSISHALESIWNKSATPISRAFAFESLELSNNALPEIFSNNLDIRMRRDLQSASTLAGLAISQTRTSIAHAISYPLTTFYGIPHGLAAGFTLLKLIENNRSLFGKRENHIIHATSSVLRDFRLAEKILRYASQSQFLSHVDQVLGNGRSLNYPMKLNEGDVRDIIIKSLEYQ